MPKNRGNKKEKKEEDEDEEESKMLQTLGQLCVAPRMYIRTYGRSYSPNTERKKWRS